MYADILDLKHLHSLVVNHRVDWVVHFSALLSAIGEKDVSRALQVCRVMIMCRSCDSHKHTTYRYHMIVM